MLIYQPFLLIAFIVLVNSIVAAQDLKTHRVMTRAVGQSSIIYVIADRLGFYRQEGLRVEPILAGSSTSTGAVIGGSAEYMNHGSAIGAILRGLPMRVLLVDSDKPPHFIVARPGIATLKELIARTVGIDDFAGASGMLVRVILEKSGIQPDKVNMRALGPPSFRFQALLAGVVDAVPLNYTLSKAAEQKGFKIIAYTGDFATDVQLTAATTLKNIQTSQNDVYKFVKATVKAQTFFFENPNDEAFKFFVELERLTDLQVAKEAWQARMMRTSEKARTGILDQQTMLETIRQWTTQLKLGGAPLKSETRVRPEDVYDFSFATRAHEELRREGFQTKQYRYVTK